MQQHGVGIGRLRANDKICLAVVAVRCLGAPELYSNKKGWVQSYHLNLLKGATPMAYQEAPKRLRRLTVEEASVLQTFPLHFEFCGSQSSKFKQIGNAVPCNLSYNVARMIMDYFMHKEANNFIINLSRQLEFENIYG